MSACPKMILVFRDSSFLKTGFYLYHLLLTVFYYVFYRQKRFTRLKLMLTSHRIAQLPNSSHLTDYIAACLKTTEQEADCDGSHIPPTQCSICGENLRLLANGVYQCAQGHGVEMCSNTAMPVLSEECSHCVLCTSPVCSLSGISRELHVMIGGYCGYCGGALQSNNALL